MGYEHAPGSKKRLVGLSVAAVSHALLIYAFTSGLGKELAHGVRRKVEVSIIEEAKAPPPPPPEERDTKESKPKPRRSPKKAWQPQAEVKTRTSSSTPSGNAITQTTDDLDQLTTKPVRKKEEKKAEEKKKRSVRTKPSLLPGCAPPRYPRRSEEKGEEGTVVLRFLVGPGGKVQESQLLQSSGYSRLDNAAKEAFSRCKFKPGTVDGLRVASWVRQPFTWRLQ